MESPSQRTERAVCCDSTRLVLFISDRRPHFPSRLVFWPVAPLGSLLPATRDYVDGGIVSEFEGTGIGTGTGTTCGRGDNGRGDGSYVEFPPLLSLVPGALRVPRLPPPAPDDVPVVTRLFSPNSVDARDVPRNVCETNGGVGGSGFFSGSSPRISSRVTRSRPLSTSPPEPRVPVGL